MSGCACAINTDVDEGDQVYIIDEGTITATSSILCYECSNMVNKGGSIYRERISPVETSTIKDCDTIYTCLTCLSIRKELFCGFFYGNLMWDLEEHITENNGFISEECLSSMIPEAREKVLKMIDAYLEQEEEDEEEV